MKKMICLNPTCDYCIDQVDFEGEEGCQCPECKQYKTGDAILRKYQSPELINKLKKLREEGKLLKANIINKKMLTGG